MQERLNQLTAIGKLYQKLEDDKVECFACAQRCVIKPGQSGICKVRVNVKGELRVPWGYVVSAQTDPIEKKPFAHFLPGSDALSFGMLGCNFRCDFCQNWITSQALKKGAVELGNDILLEITPQAMAAYAKRSGAKVIASTYNEPLISSEWAVDIFREGREAGMKTVYVSNGFATPEALEFLLPYLDGYKIDLKTMQPAHYRELGGRLEPVLDTIQKAHALGLWVEVVTLVIPGFNDSSDELWDTARFLASVSRDIPWHVTAFHPEYKRMDADATPAATLQQAAEIGQEAGLNYVYAGNLPGRVGSLENTYCPRCQELLIERRGYVIRQYRITAEGNCPKCGAKAAGVWTDHPEDVHLDGRGLPRPIGW